MNTLSTSVRARRSLGAAVIASAVALLAACGSGSTTSTTAASAGAAGSAASSSGSAAAASAGPAGTTDLSGVTLRVGQTLWPSLKTQFELAGVDKTPYTIEWSVFPGGDKQLQALGSGAIDVAQSSDIPPIFARAGNNTAFKVVAVQEGNTLLQEVLASKESGITSIAGLKGKKVAYVKSTTAQYFLAKLLDSAGLKWSDITPVALAPADGATALSSGNVDALASYGASLQVLRSKGAVQIGSGKDILSGNFPIEVATSALADPKKKAAVIDLLGRLDKAQAHARDHAKEYVDKQVVFTKQPADAALEIFTDGEQQRATRIVPTSPEAIAKQQDVADTFLTLGALTAKVDVASYWTDELNADVAKVTDAS
jgi:sulfonate transport system substrate-binding protein